MKRLLIVDDEHHIVNWLADLFESNTTMELIVLRSYTGQEALEILENTKIDVVLLDIKMPGLNGLQVAEKILSTWPSCRIVFLTGFNNFDYIYYASKHKQISYLLKTEPDEVIMKTVFDAFASIEQEQLQFQATLRSSINEKLANHFLYQNYLKTQFSEKNADAKQPDIFPLDLKCPVLLLYIHIFSRKESNDGSLMSAAIYESIQIMEQILYGKLRYSLLEYDQNTLLCFLQPVQTDCQPDYQYFILYLKECFDDMISLYGKKFYETMLLLYEEEIPFEKTYDIFCSIRNYLSSPEQLEQKISCGTIFKKNALDNFEQADTNTLIHANLTYLETQLDEMSLFLDRSESKQILHLIRKVKFFCKDITSMHYFPVIGIYHKMSSMLISYIYRHNLVESIAYKIELYPLYYTNNFNDWKEAFGYLERLTSILFESPSEKQPDTNQILIHTIKNYISEHLSQNLTLTFLSNLINYNSSYVSRVFKHETGMNLSEYITLTRIEKAKELLRFSDDSIRTISEQVGFDTTQYFSMVFKKQTGLTPSEFRLQNNISENH